MMFSVSDRMGLESDMRLNWAISDVLRPGLSVAIYFYNNPAKQLASSHSQRIKQRLGKGESHA